MGWLRRLFSRERLEADLDKELRFHFESQVADNVRSGSALEFRCSESHQEGDAGFPNCLELKTAPIDFWRNPDVREPLHFDHRP
jgi:hypothetical protein